LGGAAGDCVRCYGVVVLCVADWAPSPPLGGCVGCVWPVYLGRQRAAAVSAVADCGRRGCS